MNEPLIFGLIAFVFMASITPGPNNLMLMSSVMLFGFRRTLPHMLGVYCGFTFLLIAAILGFGELLIHVPAAELVIKLAGSLWLCWLGFQFLKEAFRQHMAKSAQPENPHSRPFYFFEAFLFQWINPKALIMALSSAGLYVDITEDLISRLIVMTMIFTLVGMPCGIAWMILGRGLTRWLGPAGHGRVINLIMALLIFGLVGMILMV